MNQGLEMVSVLRDWTCI